ncbi:MAG: oligosaccharide flippase family protein [Pseudomonadota bacterium]
MSKTFLINVGSLSASRLFLALSQILVLPVVARFLSPDDFGDMALAMGIVVFAQLLSDAGLGRSLIRQPTMDPKEWSAVFWLLAAVGVGLTVLLTALAPLWAALFDRPRMLALVPVLASVVLLNALAAVPIARLEKDGQFPAVAWIRTAAGLGGIVAILSLAAAGAGVWALVGQQIALAAIQTGLAAAVTRFRPQAPRDFPPLGHHIRFASDNVGTSLLFTGQTQAPILLLGYVLGAAPLGLFAVAQRFLTLPRTGLAGPVAQVVYVRMAAAQADPAEVARIYVASCRLLAFAAIPPIFVLAGAGFGLFPLLLSETWTGVAMVFALAAPGIAIEVATSSAGVMFQAMDQTRLRLRMAFERMVLRTLAVAVAVPFGLNATALALSLFALAYTPRYLAFAARIAPVRQRDVLASVTGPVVVGALAWLGLVLIGPRIGGWPALALAATALIVAWAVAALVQRTALQRALSTVRD